MHKPVLLNEIVGALDPKEGEIFVDCTLNGGGHSEAMSKKGAKIIGIDMDEDALKRASKKLPKDAKLFQENFRNLDSVLEKAGEKEVDCMLFDLGWSSDQIEPPEGGQGRGFSFLKNEELLMTFRKMPKEDDLTASVIVNEWEEDNIKLILKNYGEEKFSGRIARGIVESRAKKPIKTTFDLVEIIKAYVPARFAKGKLHPATQTFQALRIAVNDEIRALEEGIAKGFDALKDGGKMAIISFHSIEDRIVKRFFNELVKSGKGNVYKKKPIIASEIEVEDNPRSRSAKLRIFIKNDKEQN